MNIKYSQAFKDKMVKQVLSREAGVSIQSIAESAGVGLTAIRRWVKQSQEHSAMSNTTEKEKRPEDWNASERLQAIIACDDLAEEALNTYCRTTGIYPHHIEQWKRDILTQGREDDKANRQTIKQLRSENKELQKELNRKEKALAETAALLTLKKKAQLLWGNDEGNT